MFIQKSARYFDPKLTCTQRNSVLGPRAAIFDPKQQAGPGRRHPSRLHCLLHLTEAEEEEKVE